MSSGGPVDVRFLGLAAGVTAAGGALAWPLVDGLDGGRSGLLAGLAFSLASVVLGYHWLRWSARREGRTFLIAALGGFTARVAAVLLFALAIAFGTAANLVVALLTVAVLHVLLGFVEIAYFHRTEAIG